MQAEWHFEEVGPMGGAMGNAYANTLQGAGRTPEEELAREAIQNSCDAAAEGSPVVRVEFRMVSLKRKEKEEFLDLMQLKDGFGARIDRLKLPSNNCFSEGRKPLDLVFVEDFGTVGLGGNPHSRHSNFYRLLLSLGESGKTYSAGTGGSYGYGKAALSMNSRIRTIVAYTRFLSNGTGEAIRLMACAYFDSYDYQQREWTGRVWFGMKGSIEHKEVISPRASRSRSRKKSGVPRERSW
jgi:hypothetical protein